ncbi:MAG: DUF3127 domain-containing protein [Planctomycetota bacterium]|nr:DUF3127 domain-containing protein [Planctomycetota bacterium]
MSNPTVRGIVHLIEETKTFGQKGFRKRLVVLEQEDGQFTNYIPIDFLRDDCDSVDKMRVGNDVEVAYRLSGRKWQRDSNSEVKFFLNAEAVGFQILGGSDQTSDDGPPADYNPEPPPETYVGDDAPF